MARDREEHMKCRHRNDSNSGEAVRCRRVLELAGHPFQRGHVRRNDQKLVAANDVKGVSAGLNHIQRGLDKNAKAHRSRTSSSGREHLKGVVWMNTNKVKPQALQEVCNLPGAFNNLLTRVPRELGWPRRIIALCVLHGWLEGVR